MMGFASIYSFALRPSAGRKQSPENAVPRSASRWVAAGALCFALQGLLIVSSISFYGRATVANVLYSSRVLWSVLAVWAVGHWFGNRERDHGSRVLAWRLVGAVLLMVAIGIVLLDARRSSSKAVKPIALEMDATAVIGRGIRAR
jgi:hypothetical protein